MQRVGPETVIPTLKPRMQIPVYDTQTVVYITLLLSSRAPVCILGAMVCDENSFDFTFDLHWILRAVLFSFDIWYLLESTSLFSVLRCSDHAFALQEPAAAEVRAGADGSAAFVHSAMFQVFVVF